MFENIEHIYDDLNITVFDYIVEDQYFSFLFFSDGISCHFLEIKE